MRTIDAIIARTEVEPADSEGFRSGSLNEAAAGRLARMNLEA